MNIKIAFLTMLTLIVLSCTQEKPTLESVGFLPIDSNTPIPDIKLTNADGSILNMDDYRGKLLLLNFWATWCPPCRAEIPALNRMYGKINKKNFAMLAVNVGEEVELVEEFMAEYDVGFPVVFDHSQETTQTMGVQNLPTSILLDENLNGIAVVTGVLEWDSNEMIQLLNSLSD